MATVAPRRPAGSGRVLAGLGLPTAAGIAGLVAFSLALRTTRMGTPFWIDEGLAVGIAGHPLADIPGLLAQDGSPPLYFMVLHVWMAVFGRSEEATHALSLLFAALTIPAAFWAGSSLFGRRTGWILAALASTCPFITAYAQETRMYALVILLGTLATACFGHAYVFGRRSHRVPFGLLLAALLYTHNWALLYAGGLVLALAAIARAAPDRRALGRDVAVGFGLAAVLYAPWVPTLAEQIGHTGAPWADPPSLTTLARAPDKLLGGRLGAVLVLLAAGTGLVAAAWRSRRERVVLVPVLLSLAVGPVVLGWLVSQISPVWASRYLAIAIGPLLLLAAFGLTRAGRLGLAGLALLTVVWLATSPPSAKSNARDVATTLGPRLKPGDLVVSTQPEQLPVLSHYLPKGLQHANPFGPVRDPGVVNWRDGAEHFDRTGAARQLRPLLDGLPPGRRVLLVVPIIEHPERWRTPWGSRVRARSRSYERVLRGDERFVLGDVVPADRRRPGPNPVQGLLFEKRRGGLGTEH